MIVAATFLAAVGDVRRSQISASWSALGLDPRVRQSGSTPATHGRISSKAQRPPARALRRLERGRQPGPLRAFYQRIRARRGHQVAVVAAARKLACLFWCMLTRGEDYAFQQPSLTKKKLRRLELQAGAERGNVKAGIWSTNDAMRRAERDLARQAELAYSAPSRLGLNEGASATQGDAISKPPQRQAARQGISPKPCALARRPAPPQTFARSRHQSTNLTFIRRAKQQRHRPSRSALVSFEAQCR